MVGPPPVAALVCANCGTAQGVEFMCARCVTEAYCSVECQRGRWKAHKATCKQASEPPRLVEECAAAQAAPRRKGAETLTSARHPCAGPLRAARSQRPGGTVGRPIYRPGAPPGAAGATLPAQRIFAAPAAAAAAASGPRRPAQTAPPKALPPGEHEAKGELCRWLEALLRPRRHLPALPPCGPGEAVNVVICSPAAPRRRTVENAGRAALDLGASLPRTASADQAPKADAASLGQEPTAADGSRTRSSTVDGRKGRRRHPPRSSSVRAPEDRRPPTSRQVLLTESLRGVDLYKLIGIDVKDPSMDDLHKAFRKQALVYHPDKLKEAPDAARKERQYVWIKDAYEYLCDPANKRLYESSRPFDNSLPSEATVRAQGFFKTLGPVFARNSKWSRTQPVPELGCESTPVEEVQRFYDFWFSFESWREPSGEFQHACGQEIESTFGLRREDRRFVEKQNEKLRRKFTVQEESRIHALVCLARKVDPRLAEERRGRRSAR